MDNRAAAELTTTLDSLIALLSAEPGQPWVEPLSQAQMSLISNPLVGARAFLHLYGGMGSFGDFGISGFDANGVLDPRLVERSNEFDRLSTSAHSMAEEVLAGLSIADRLKLTPIRDYLVLAFMASLLAGPVILLGWWIVTSLP